MANKLFPDVPAARHMKVGAAAEAPARSKGARSADGTALVRPAGAARPEPARVYRRKRLAVLMVSALVCLSVPALLLLLYLLG